MCSLKLKLKLVKYCFKKSFFMIPLPKKPNAIECRDYCTISLIPRASKSMLKIFTKRIESKAKHFIGPNQFGFRKGCGTREAIGVVRMPCERSIEHNNDVYICFVDFEKAFDRVNWVKMMDALKSIGVDWRDRRLIRELYIGQEAVIRVANGESMPATIGRGVRQGCPLSPLLFSIYAEKMMIEAIEDIDEGVNVGGNLVKDVKFADDQGMVASSEQGLQRLMDALATTANKYDMKINIKKTKTMLVSKSNTGGTVNIVIDGQLVEQVNKFQYLESMMTEDGRCTTEVKGRIAMAKDAFSKRKELLSRNMSRAVRKKIIKTVVCMVALYGSETWALKKDEIQRLNALEMWIWRRMEKVSYKNRKTNEEVLDIVGEERSLIETIVRRKKNWIGHILREGLLKDVIEGRMEGKPPRGRKRIGMLDDLKEESY